MGLCVAEAYRVSANFGPDFPERALSGVNGRHLRRRGRIGPRREPLRADGNVFPTKSPAFPPAARAAPENERYPPPEPGLPLAAGLHGFRFVGIRGRTRPMSARHVYNPTYYRYINQGSLQSARVLLPLVTRHFRVRSVADFGAGQGAWLSVWQDLGATDVIGLDGEYVRREGLLIPPDRFVASDLTKPVRLNRRFDLVQSLEVAEHLPPQAAA